jgi:hypothetical protein
MLIQLKTFKESMGRNQGDKTKTRTRGCQVSSAGTNEDCRLEWPRDGERPDHSRASGFTEAGGP